MQFSWISLLYILAIYGLVRFFSRTPEDQQPKKVNWSPLESVAVTLFIYFFGQLFGGLIIYGLPTLFGISQDSVVQWVGDDAIGQFITILVVDAISIFLLLRFLKKRNNSLRTIGFVKKIKLSDFGYAVGYYMLYFLVYLLIIQLVINFIPAVDVDQKQQIGFEAVSQWKLPIVFISLVVLPSLVEEILVRGFMYGGLRNREKIPKYLAIFITSFVFAIAHLQFGSGEKLLWIAAIDTFILSIFLIALREKTGRLWSPIFLHAIKNSIAFISIFILKIN